MGWDQVLVAVRKMLEKLQSLRVMDRQNVEYDERAAMIEARPEGPEKVQSLQDITRAKAMNKRLRGDAEAAAKHITDNPNPNP